MKYKITLSNVQLKTNPIGLDRIQYKFERDDGLFGIFAIAVLNLTFVGDGFCILRDIQNSDENLCSVPIRIEFSCDEGQNFTTIFNGNIPLAKIKINNSEQKAFVEIEDNSPLALISQNAEIDFDYNSTQDIFGNPLKQLGSPYTTIQLYDEIGNYEFTDVKAIPIKEAIEFIMNFMTGYEVQFESDFLNSTQPQQETWRLTFDAEPGTDQDTTITYTNFYNQQTTINEVSSGDTHVEVLARRLRTLVLSAPGIPDEIREFWREFDQKYFQTSNDFTSGTHWAEWNTPIPFEINSVVTVGTAGIESITKTQSFIDAAFGIHFIDWSGLHELDGKIKLTFKKLITEINKATGCSFFVFVNPATNTLHVRLEDDSYYLNNSFIKTFDNIRDYIVESNVDTTYGTVQVGSTQSQNSNTNETQTFSSLYCGLDNRLDLKNEFIMDSVQIWVDLAAAYNPDDTNSNIYMVQVESGQAIQYPLQYTRSTDFVSLGEGNSYNLYLNNNMSLIRHMSKFRNDFHGSPDKIITNTATEKIYKKYSFTTNMNYQSFIEFADSVPDRVRFKMLDETEYKSGIVKEITYNYSDGKANFIVLGS